MKRTEICVDVAAQAFSIKRETGIPELVHPVLGKVVSISPRSYRMGEQTGWMSGLGVGFAVGLVVGLLMASRML